MRKEKKDLGPPPRPSLDFLFFGLLVLFQKLLRARARFPARARVRNSLSLALSFSSGGASEKKNARAFARAQGSRKQTGGRSTPSIFALAIFFFLSLALSLSPKLTKRLVLRKGRGGSERERDDSELEEGRHDASGGRG